MQIPAVVRHVAVSGLGSQFRVGKGGFDLEVRPNWEGGRRGNAGFLLNWLYPPSLSLFLLLFFSFC
jgi:hypothetical protein